MSGKRFGKKGKLSVLDDAVAKGLQYLVLTSTNVGGWNMTDVLNEAWTQGYRLVDVAGQQATTLFVLERRSEG